MGRETTKWSRAGLSHAHSYRPHLESCARSQSTTQELSALLGDAPSVSAAGRGLNHRII